MAKEAKEPASRDEDIEDVVRTVADRLAAARKARGWTQKQFGEMADMSQQRIFELEQGVGNITIRTLSKMAKILDIDVHTLFVGSGPSVEYGLANSMAKLMKMLEDRGAQDSERREQEELFRSSFLSIIQRLEQLTVRKPTKDK
ncbi:helix-turn-helix domain-containing protein [Acidisoma silvae]|uniref:Helix-turn-helix transcriptional regulator n=1 Tax=Acidisoma silvae TaxID=2802396 RepID=A0A963YWH4_9PROT|nr:helix-turn-helix transcriptional regulator [Acidisoma silvae]MCB8877433.1 helix-turn-helix transcriptional regulator [Acidisoma silvae]